MANATNIFGLTDLYFSGSNGDVSSSNGQLTISGAIGQKRATYVDYDYVNMRKQGLLAYPDLQRACQAWEPGGEATLRFGLPSETGRGTVLIGPGTYEICTGNVIYNSLIDYVDIKGTSRESTILTNTRFTANNNIINFNYANVNLFDFTFRPTSQTTLGLNYSDFNGILKNIKFDGTVTQTWLSFSTFFGKIIGCDFDFTSGGAIGSHPLIISNQSFNSNQYAAMIKDCTFKAFAGSNLGSMINVVGSHWSWSIQNCNFYTNGNIGNAVVYINANSTEYCLLKDSKIVVNGSGIGFSTVNQFVGQIDGCYMDTRHSAISILGTARSVLTNSYINADDNDSHGVLLSPSSNGFTASNCRIFGQGTGRAIQSFGTFNIAVDHCALRKPNSNGAGSSISSSLTNSVEFPWNSELDASTIT